MTEQQDYGRFLSEYGFADVAIRTLVEDMTDHVPMPQEFGGLAAGRSPIQGCGMFSTATFTADEIVAPARLHGGRTLAGRWVNHSPRNNCRIKPSAGDALLLCAKRPIVAGEELTVDYRQAGSVNGWHPQPCRAEMLYTLRMRAVALRGRGQPWSSWAEMPLERLSGVLARLLDEHGYLPSLDDTEDGAKRPVMPTC